MFFDRSFRIRSYFLYIYAFCFIDAILILLYFSFLKSSMIMITRKICIADFINVLSNGNFFLNIILIPLCTVFTTVASEHNCSTINYYIRNKSRTSIILKMIKKILFFSVVATVIILLVSIVVASFLTSELINWNKQESYFYMSTGTLLDIDLIKVLLLSFFKLIFPISFFSSLAYTISLICKKTFSFLIIVLMSSSNFIGFIKFIIDGAFDYNISETSYLNFSSAVLIFVIFSLATLIVVFFAVRLARRKDFLN